jgi:hypothetical protein
MNDQEEDWPDTFYLLFLALLALIAYLTYGLVQLVAGIWRKR